MRKGFKPEYKAAIAELHRLVREPFETPPDLRQLRARLNADRLRRRQKLLVRLSKHANIDLRAIYDETRRSSGKKRRDITDTLRRLEAEALKRSKIAGARFHTTRRQYLKTFAEQLADAQGTTELKFRNPFYWFDESEKGDCNYTLGGTDPDVGIYEASSEIEVSTDTPGMWLFPRLFIDTRDCDDTEGGRTFQELSYAMGPPTQSFGVNAVRVDLMANGVASCVFGDLDCLQKPSRLYTHSFVQLDVVVSQKVGGGFQHWPLVSDRIFSGNDEYVKDIRALLSGQTYPVDLTIRSAADGGGDLLCHLQIACSTSAVGTDGRVRLDFGQANVNGIFVGGVALLGGFV